MRHEQRQRFLALTLALFSVVSTASAEEPAGGWEDEDSSTSSEESSEHTPGSAIVAPDKTSLQLGYESLETTHPSVFRTEQ